MEENVANRKQRLAYRLIVGFSIILLVVISGFLYLKIKMSLISNDLVYLYEHPFVVRQEIDKANIGIISMHRSMKDVVLSSNPGEIDLAERIVNENERKVYSALALVRERYLGENSDIDSVEACLTTWRPIREEVISLSRAGEKEQAAAITKGKGAIRVALLGRLLGKVSFFATVKAGSLKEEAIAHNNSAEATMYVVMLGIIILTLVIGILVTRSIVMPVTRLTTLSRSMAQGILDQQIEVKSHDEIGALAESFMILQTSMLEKVTQAREIAEGNLVVRVELLSEKDQMGMAFRTMVDRLRQQIKEIGDGINVLATATSEITASISQLAATSSETATSVAQASATVEEVKQTAEVASYKAKEVSDNSVKSVTISKEGNRAVENTITGMNRIQQQMDLIANTVVSLSEQNQAIGEIVSTVNELAEQSNLLAVNAAIEAAKAGEQGKGFTVVAREIKNLAIRSKEATAEVNSILRDVRKQINSAVLATEEGNKVVSDGIRLTRISGESLQSLTTSFNEAVNSAIQIAASSQQQVEGMNQVAQAMENIRESTLQASASTNQTFESVKELQQLGEQLKNMIDQYTV
ncbi:MAG: methyl-accepting chemotaxis protein [Bacteroidetes bacterium]|nr:methyl-accepting chemotaxis protein [Bacteroidota bacterium]